MRIKQSPYDFNQTLFNWHFILFFLLIAYIFFFQNKAHIAITHIELVSTVTGDDRINTSQHFIATSSHADTDTVELS